MADNPMPRLPDYRRDYVGRREDVVASAVAAVLRTEGRVVENPYRPVEGQARHPDWMLTLDGEPTALEVTRLLPPAHVQKAQHVVTRIETGVATVSHRTHASSLRRFARRFGSSQALNRSRSGRRSAGFCVPT